MRAIVVGLLLALPLAGCAGLDPPGPREVAGPTDGYSPTASFLKVHVRQPDHSLVMLSFDRTEWYTAKIAELVDLKQMTFVSAHAQPRETLNEYMALDVAEPSDVAKLRYDAMQATPEQRAQMDAEHEALLKEWLARTPAAPTTLLPQHPLP